MAVAIADVALLTDHRYTASTAAADDWYLDNILSDDRLLQAALEARGISSLRVDWADPHIDWSQFRLAVFRTTWDYFDRWAEFSSWLQAVKSQTKLCNDYATVRWNTDKHYLADLQTRGVNTVPSHFVERGSRVTLLELLSTTGWENAVIKPCVSGAARHTYRVNQHNAGTINPIMQELLTAESLILQPFQQHILDHGEETLMVFNGRYSHAVRKVAKPGDFRVQDDHGGKAFSYQPTAEQIELAERAMSVCDRLPVYGRVDMIRDNAGELAIMELELIEPELWLRFHPPAAVPFAAAIVEQLEA